MQIKKQEPHAMMQGKILPISCERRRVYSRLHFKGHSLDLAVGERSSVGKFSTVFEQGPIVTGSSTTHEGGSKPAGLFHPCRHRDHTRTDVSPIPDAADSDAILLLEVRRQRGVDNPKDCVSVGLSFANTNLHKLRTSSSTHPHWRQPHRTPRSLWSPPAHASTGSPGRCGSAPSEAEDGKVRLDGESQGLQLRMPSSRRSHRRWRGC